ncbi:hypothetical protein FRB94_009613 [Tulasnella sp. JGI-2019a]|nr:hypothetical protein FRB94_009613 [Tulasnella sp. JGI-2019a]KAG8996838.1 hypothetical protein FRB93_000650 [Tulasnella sp. JGI-2019a]KAG9035001.1 hypothetical protein FRB95_012291 [Tulasnella sp. JGI-2019a]
MATNFPDDSVDTLLSYHPPSYSMTKEPNFGQFSSRKQGLRDMSDVMGYVATFISQNKWVSPLQAERFANIYQRHKEQYEKAKGKNIFVDYCNSKGHFNSELLWTDLRQLKSELEDAGTLRMKDTLVQQQKRRAEQKKKRLATMSATMSTHSEDPQDDQEAAGTHSADRPSLIDGHPAMAEAESSGAAYGLSVSASHPALIEPDVWEFTPEGPECNRAQEPGATVLMDDTELAARIDR